MVDELDGFALDDLGGGSKSELQPVLADLPGEAGKELTSGSPTEAAE